MCFSPQRRAIFRHRIFKKCFGADVFCTFSLPNVLFATAACIFSTSELQKVLRHRQFSNIFTSEYAFRHCGMQLFDIRTSKSAPRTTVFQHFDFRMCFSPQRRAIFRHQNFKKCSEDYSFSTFSLPNVLFATAALQKVLQRLQFFNIVTSKSAPQFSTSELQKVLRGLQFFNIFTSECAFRHSGVQFFVIRTSKSSPKTTVFQHLHFQMCFSPQRPAIFRHQNFKKCPDTGSFLTFSLPNVLFATAACNFSTSELQKVLRRLQFFNIRVSGQSKSRLVKAAGAEVGAQRRSQKLHAAVAKSAVGSENAQKLTVSEHFLKFWCRKIACRCGEKHIWMWKCWKTDGVGALFEVLMSKNCMPLWRKAHSLTFGADVSSFFWLSRYCIFLLLTWLLYSAFPLSILSEVSI